LGKVLSVTITNVERRMVLIMKRRTTMFIFSFLGIFILIQGTPVIAHTPSSMNLSYDFASQVLTVDVSHSVSDVVSHRIATVTIEKNSVQVINRVYSSQNTTSGFSATYHIPAVDGDVLSVTAVCSISGQVADEITVSDPAATTTPTTPEPSTTPTPTNGYGFPLSVPLLIAVAVVVLGVVLVIVVLVKRR
jgi:hypothetical protein